MTTGERTAQIDRDLNDSLGVFDNRIRDEQATIAGQRSGGRGGSGGGAGSAGAAGAGNSESGNGSEGDGKGGQGGGGEGQQGGGAQGGQGAGQGGSGQGQGQQGQGEGNQQGGGGGVGGGARGGSGPNTVPADIPDGSDDDIVARQLREAAMNETDPELREKLWQEYRDYKKNTG
jgi:hypothetical protein